MIYYQAVCEKHTYSSSLYVRRGDAVRSGRRHRNTVSSPHKMVILEVFIPNNIMEIKAKVDLD